MPAPWSSWTRWAPTPPFLPFNGWSKKGQGAYGSVPRNRGKNTTLLSSMTIEGMGPSLAVEGATDTKVFETYVERVLAPRLREGQVVVMDNLSAHKGERVRELIEQRGCELLYLPSYSPDFNPIEEAFGKMKGFLRRVEARSRVAAKPCSKPSGRRSRRLAIETPVGSSSTAATVQRFNRFDHSCRSPDPASGSLQLPHFGASTTVGRGLDGRAGRAPVSKQGARVAPKPVRLNRPQVVSYYESIYEPSRALEITCPNCETVNPEGAKFCLNCGNRLETQVRVDGERKHVTVLFADVVDSTGLGERLDPEQVAEIMNGVFAFLNASVKKYGGTVARLLGDAVLAFFGAPVAHEDDAERAVRAGLEIQAKAREYAQVTRRDYGVDFNMRVGINTGLVVLATMGGDEIRTEYTAMGDTTNVAARMQNAAMPGTVLISADTYHLVKQLFEFKPRGATEVRGKSAPIETYEVLAPKAVPGKVRGLEGEGLSSPLVGRAAECQLVHDKLEDVREGRGAFVAVVGEAGLGKSRLLAEVRKAATSESQPPLAWLEGRALSYEQAVTYYPWRQVIREAIGAKEGEVPEVVREKLHSDPACATMPEGNSKYLEVVLSVESNETLKVLTALEGDALVEHITAATRGYLRARADLKPQVIVLDDVHWADTASLDLLLKDR